MRREPLYWPQAATALDRLEAASETGLHRAVRAAIDVICDHGDSAEARREQIRAGSGMAVWMVRVRTREDDWVVLWWPVGRDAQIYFIGEM